MSKHGDADWGTPLGVGLQVAVGVGLGLVVGRWLDNRFGWQPWGTTIGSMVGLAAGLYLLIRDAMRANKD